MANRGDHHLVIIKSFQTKFQKSSGWLLLQHMLNPSTKDRAAGRSLRLMPAFSPERVPGQQVGDNDALLLNLIKQKAAT